jgi:hypothetical protein
MTQPDGGERPQGELDELTLEIRRVIEENRKFLERISDDEFEDEEPPDDDVLPEEEL